MARNPLNRAESVAWIKMIILLEKKKAKVGAITTFSKLWHNGSYFIDIQNYRVHAYSLVHNRESFAAMTINMSAGYVLEKFLKHTSSNRTYYNMKRKQQLGAMNVNCRAQDPSVKNNKIKLTAKEYLSLLTLVVFLFRPSRVCPSQSLNIICRVKYWLRVHLRIVWTILTEAMNHFLCFLPLSTKNTANFIFRFPSH